jgi:two-component system, sensor histidine kinase and response regulator
MLQEYSYPARLLVVDDKEANLRTIGDVLGQFGYDIILASDGDEALRQLDGRPVDLILLDLIMPGRDGFETCQLIRKQPRWADIPIIFLSAADDKDLVVRALEMGGVDYITKPFNKAELMSRVRTHIALKTARDQLMQLAEDKDELIGILTHDLKNHLGGIRMSIELLHDRARIHRDDRLERAADNIRNFTVQMLSFVHEFLANSAADRGLSLEIEPLSLNHAMTSAVRNHAESAHYKGIILEHEDEADASVAADRKALDQVLDNLISNALKFSPPGKSVRVSVRPAPHGGVFSVQDEGPGFTEDDKARMFRRYGRLSARPTGGEPSTGLGLSIVKKLVDAMGGRIECESHAGRGATFRVNLPGPNGNIRRKLNGNGAAPLQP